MLKSEVCIIEDEHIYWIHGDLATFSNITPTTQRAFTYYTRTCQMKQFIKRERCVNGIKAACSPGWQVYNSPPP